MFGQAGTPAPPAARKTRDSWWRSVPTCAGCTELPRQTQHALRDDVALHLGGAGIDGRGARPQQLVAPQAIVCGTCLALREQTVGAEDLESCLLEPLLQLTPEDLEHRALGTGLAGALHHG